MKKNFILLTYLLLLIISSKSANAATVTWTGGGSDNLASNPANWSGNTAPQYGDDVVFDNTSKDCTWDITVTLASLTIGSGYTGTVTLSSSADLTIAKDFVPPSSPYISASPSGYDFGSVNVGSSSPSQTFTISNTGTANLVIGAIYLTGANLDQFVTQNDTCSGMTIAPSAACTVEVACSPTSAGALTANLGIPSNDPDTPNIYIVMTGTGVIPQYILTVTKAGTGSGIVTSADGLINCGATCSAIYNAGTTLALTATPDASSTFAGWSGACAGAGTCTVTINADTPVTATFNIKTFTITAGAGVGGSILPSGAVVMNYGANQTFTITPDAGYQVTNVVVDGVSVGAVTSYTFTNVTADHTISAAFSEIPNISASPSGYDFGSVNVGSSSSPQIFTISNTGIANLVIGAIYLTGANLDQFVTQNDTCSGMTIAPSATCTIEVFFIPSFVGTLTADLTIPSNDPDTPMLNIGLSGRGFIEQCL